MLRSRNMINANTSAITNSTNTTNNILELPSSLSETTNMKAMKTIEIEENETLLPKSESNKPMKLSCFIIEAILLSSLGGVLFGYDLGIISNALPELCKTFKVTTIQKENIVSFLYIGGVFGASFGGILCDKFGRKVTILLTDVIFFMGSVILYKSTSYDEVILGRFILGFGISTSGIADVSYLHEISPTAELRGALVSCNEACISLGFLISYLVGYIIINYYNSLSVEGWRVMFGISGIIAIIQFIGMLFMPESPKWLLSRGRVDEAKQVMIYIHGSPYDIDNEEMMVEDEMVFDNNTGITMDNIVGGSKEMTPLGLSNTTNSTYNTIDDTTNTTTSPKKPIKTLNNNKTMQKIMNTYQQFQNNIPQICIALFLSMSQQFSGHHNILNFVTDIFNDKSSSSMTLILGIVKFITTIIIIFKIESIGRRTLLLGGISCMCLCHLLLGITLSRSGNDDDTIRLVFLLIGTIGVVIGYASSFGPLTWLLTSEMFHTSIRGRALGISTILNYITASVLSYAFLSLQESFHNISIPFYMYSITCLTSFLFCFVAIPNYVGDTSTCDSIDNDIRKMKFWKFMIHKYYYFCSLFLKDNDDGVGVGNESRMKCCFCCRCFDEDENARDENFLQLLEVVD